MFNLTILFKGDKEPIEVQTNLWSVVKDYIKNSDNYLLTNEEGTIIDCIGISKLLSFMKKECEKPKYREQKFEMTMY